MTITYDAFTISTDHAAGFELTGPDSKKPRYYGNLTDLAHGLVKHAGMDADDAQLGVNADLVASELSRMWEPALNEGCTLTLGSGRFHITKGAGDWRLSNPAKDASRLRGSQDVGFYPSLRAAIFNAALEALRAREDSIDYFDVDARLLGEMTFLKMYIGVIEPAALQAV